MKVLLSLVLMAFAFVADFTGTYKATVMGSDYVMVFKQKDNAVTGHLRLAETNLPLTATVNGDKIEGSIALLDEKIFFKGTLKGDRIAMELADQDANGKADWSTVEKMEFVREGGAPTKAEKESAVKKIFKKEATGTLKDGKEYVHASGGKFRYPKDWTLRENAELQVLELSPGDKQEGETIFISAESANGKTSPTDPEVVAYLDGLISQSAPGFARKEKPSAVPAGNGAGALYIWESGNNQIRAYVTILKNRGASLIGIGTKDQLEKRDPIFREIFYTFGWGQGKVDTQLVGSWQYYSYSQVSGRETKAKAILNGDGTFSYQSESEAASNLSGKDGLGNETWTGWVNSRSGSGYKGTWSADGTTLTLNFEDGSSESFDYRFEQQGTAFVIKLFGDDKSKPMEWSKIG
jgi:hypothetical protein